MMFNLLLNGQIDTFILILFVIILSLSFHEFGHAWTAKKFGDNTAERQGRLTLNPIAHIDPMGLLMVATIGFGYAKPVPTDPRNFNSPYASAWISAAGPAMNLLLAIIAINFLAAIIKYDFSIAHNPGVIILLKYMTFINLLLMLFNLLPIGLLDGHYILPYFLSKTNAILYLRWNYKYGNMVLFSLIALSFLGVPIFSSLTAIIEPITRMLIIF